MSEFSKNESTLVYPGGATKCIFSSSTPFAFQVWPGDKDKILIFFQGGGACWNKASTVIAPLCTLDVYPQSEVGIFDRSDKQNTFANYTIVHISYCSGDLFIGNVTRPYNHGGEPVVQVGYTNTQATLDWIKLQQDNGALSNTFSDIVVSGCSAGSIGAQVWGNLVLEQFNYNRASVTPDSYIGVFPTGVQGPLIYDYGACSVPLIPPELKKPCEDQTLTLQEYVKNSLEKDADVPWTYIQSKADATQISFYAALATSVGKNPYITPKLFYRDCNDIMEQYNDYDNFVTYLVDGSQHCFTPSSVYYKATPTGPHYGETMIDSTYPPLFQWVNTLPLNGDSIISTICEGTAEIPPGSGGAKYCDENLNPKNFPKK